MASSLHRELAHARADLLLYAADAQDALKHLPERVYHLEFEFAVTAHHLTRFVRAHVRQLTVVDGWLDFYKQRYEHSWLATPAADYIIDVSPIGIACNEPIIISIGNGSLWGRHYNASADRKPTDPRIDEEAKKLVQLADGAQQFLHMP